MQRWSNFDLELADYDVVGDTATAHVRVARSPAGELRDPVTVTLPALPATVTERLNDAHLRLSDLIELGRALTDLLLPADARALFDHSVNRLAADEGLRLRLLVRALPLAELPFELMYLQPPPGSAPERGFVALDRRLSLVRYEPVSRPAERWPALQGTSLKVAMLLSDPDIPGWGHLDLAREIAALESALRDEPGVALTVHPNAHQRQLNDALDARPHVFHFAGHGRFVMQPTDQFGVYAGRGELLLEDEQGSADPVPARELAARMHGSGVRLAVLNSCESARRDEASAFTGIAPTLVRDGVPAVIAMQYRIRDRQALVFSRRLYHNLAAHQSIDSAVVAARIAMFEERDDRGWDFAVPVLYLRSDQSVLFPDPDAPMRDFAPRRRFSVQEITNLALAAALVFVLAFFYLRHIEPRLPFGTVIGGLVAAAALAATGFLATVAGDAVRGVALGWLRRRLASGVLAGALAATVAAALTLPAPVALRVLPGKTLIGRLAPAELVSPQRTYTLEVRRARQKVEARDFRKSGVALAASGALAGRLDARNVEILNASMRDYLERNGPAGQAERYFGLWRPAPQRLGLAGFGGGKPVTLALRQDSALVACRAVTQAELTAELNVIYLEDGDVCD